MLAQWIGDLAARPPRLPGAGAAARLARSALVAAGDPLVRCAVGDFSLELPLSHELPRYLASFPGYGSNIGRLARAVARKYPAAGVIDIGANVGDTAALVRSACAAPVLCVEGDARFFAILERNARRIGGLHLERAFIGARDESLAARFESRNGTGRIVPSREGQLRTEPLEAVLARHSRFPEPRLLKIDTDGADCAILDANLPLLARLKPALFFEYDPAFLGEGYAPVPFFARLSEAGYEFALVYDNFGDLLVSTGLDRPAVLEDLHHYFSGRGSRRYADLAIFHAADRSLGEAFRREELLHFKAARG